MVPSVEGPAHVYGTIERKPGSGGYATWPSSAAGDGSAPAKTVAAQPSAAPVKKHTFETVDWTFQSERYRLHREKQIRVNSKRFFFARFARQAGVL